MPIERDKKIEFHELGTLLSVTRWISKHDEGLAEWLKNARRAYLPDRANVAEPHRAAVLLLKDLEAESPTRLGLLDVGGATLEDLDYWSTWQDPEASSRGSGLHEEETQGNGGKAYMYRLFKGQSRILGVSDGELNCKGFEGEPTKLERGRPGFIPDRETGRARKIASVEDELKEGLKPYGIQPDDLPDDVHRAIVTRQAFTLVEGIDPVDTPPTVWGEEISCDEIVRRVLRHEQSTLAIEQLRLYAIHNGKVLNSGEPLRLEEILPYPGYEEPIVHEIPEYLPDSAGVPRSTTLEGERSRGTLTIRTSRENMDAAWRRLKPRWKVSYRTKYQMIGAKSVGELVPTTPGSQFVYATVELDAFEPDHVTVGRTRPKDGLLTEMIDLYVAEKLREVAQRISELKRDRHDEETVDEVHEENKKLDEWKNRFLESGGEGDGGGGDDGGKGGRARRRASRDIDWGDVPNHIELGTEKRHFRIGRGVSVRLDPILQPVVRDHLGRPVGGHELEWISNNQNTARFTEDDELVGLAKGTVTIRVRVRNVSVVSEQVTIDVWEVDHVLLAPREIDLPIGVRKLITAEVTDDEGRRGTEVLLNWKHSADDPLVVRISPRGWVIGNRIGRTSVSAGTADPDEGGVWSRVPVNVDVVPNPEPPGPSEGFPRLLITGRDIDPFENRIRPGDPDEPALWQEPSDIIHNVWWLNLDSPDASFALSRREEKPEVWRLFHASKLAEMIAQVHMQREYTGKGDREMPDLWSRHKTNYENFQIQYGHTMWEHLKGYVLTGGGLE